MFICNFLAKSTLTADRPGNQGSSHDATCKPAKPAGLQVATFWTLVFGGYFLADGKCLILFENRRRKPVGTPFAK